MSGYILMLQLFPDPSTDLQLGKALVWCGFSRHVPGRDQRLSYSSPVPR